MFGSSKPYTLTDAHIFNAAAMATIPVLGLLVALELRPLDTFFCMRASIRPASAGLSSTGRPDGSSMLRIQCWRERSTSL
jgi:hypothetical protein